MSLIPNKKLNYGSEIFVGVSYLGKDLERFSYKIRPLPTLVSGGVLDTLRQPIANIEILMPGIGLSQLSNQNGGYNLGYEYLSGIPDGQYQIVFNAGMQNRRYGILEKKVILQSGRLNSLGINILPLINPDVPFRQVKTAQKNKAILASGDLTLDLTNATLAFPNGREYGDIQATYTTRQNIPFSSLQAVTPTWFFAIQPQGVSVAGSVDVSLFIPHDEGQIQHIPDEGILVLMIGLERQTQQLLPIGVGVVVDGKIQANDLPITSLDYIGYAYVDAESQRYFSAVTKRGNYIV
ncbi:MAG: hypothetical protein HOM11_07695 [Methylococcales bacterium]|nr:hypothetical protein [Methylococcales bacterium]MBT7444466.1 hypothetical protein [Methylococcales bacterium]